MIRPTIIEDKQDILKIAEVIEIFKPRELEEMSSLIDAYYNQELGNDHFWITLDNHGIVGCAYYAAEAFGDHVWNLYFIAVHPNQHGKGYGVKLIRHIEKALIESGARLLLIETSSLPKFDHTREFYRRQGYDEEARIREYYKVGDDKIIFRKALNSH